MGDVEGAIHNYNKAIEVKPMYADAHNNLGLCLSEKGELDAAISSFNQAILLESYHVKAFTNREAIEVQLFKPDLNNIPINNSIDKKLEKMLWEDPKHCILQCVLNFIFRQYDITEKFLMQYQKQLYSGRTEKLHEKDKIFCDGYFW